jgi:hypothetical protein
MSTRSPHNDRYKVDQKGKTRRSASSAKPKRDLGDLTPANATKIATPKKKRWGLAPAASPTPAFEPTQKMKQLRRIWWVLWGLSLLIAVGILLLQRAGSAYTQFVPFAWGLWAASMAGAFYMEFTPIRKARMEAMEAARKGGKPSKEKESVKEKSAKGVVPVPRDDTPPPPLEDEPRSDDL